MREKRGIVIREYQALALLIIFIILVGILIAFIRPGLFGMQLRNDLELQEIGAQDVLEKLDVFQSTIQALNTSLDSCQILKARYLNESEQMRTRTTLCEDEVRQLKLLHQQSLADCAFNETVLRSQLASLKEHLKGNITRLRMDFSNERSDLLDAIEEAEEKTEKWKEDYNELGEAAANNICCKNRVDNPEIDSYTIRNNKIECGAGQELLLTCQP